MTGVAPTQPPVTLTQPPATLTQPPESPTTLISTQISNSEIQLSWVDQSTTEEGFKIERKTSLGGTYGVIATVKANKTSYSDTGLASATKYYYRVFSYNSSGNSVTSNETNSTTLSSGSGVTLTVYPNAITLYRGYSQDFTSVITGSLNNSVYWIVQEGISGGTITNEGHYTAPDEVGPYNVIATSLADNSVFKIIPIQVVYFPVTGVAISPFPVNLYPGNSIQLSATVYGGAPTEGVDWSVSAGAISTNGLYSAPNTFGTFSVTATSKSNALMQSTVTVNVFRIRQISLGYSGADCLVTQDDRLFCWGANSYSSFGSATPTSSKYPLEVKNIPAVREVSSGGDHVCIVTTGNRAYCWGYNYWGQLGRGSTSTTGAPYEVSTLGATVQSIAVSERHTCAKTTTGMYCWGYNLDYRFHSTGVNKSSPFLISSLSDISKVAAGTNNSCYLRSTGNVSCWGRGISTFSIATWTTTQGTDISVGPYATVVTTSAVQEWYSPDLASVDKVVPNPVTAATGYGGHRCAITTVGAVWCWGTNHTGQLGRGYVYNGWQETPVISLLTSGAIGASGGLNSVCAWFIDGTAKCWGQFSGFSSSTSTPQWLNIHP